MEDVLHCCSLSEYNRRRAAHMMMDISDLSDHSSSDEERDPISTFTAGLPHGGDYLVEHDFNEPVEGNLSNPIERMFTRMLNFFSESRIGCTFTMMVSTIVSGHGKLIPRVDCVILLRRWIEDFTFSMFTLARLRSGLAEATFVTNQCLRD